MEHVSLFQSTFRIDAWCTGANDEPKRPAMRKAFARPTEHVDAIDVLLSSEVGSEGLDFQFCDALVNYDIPWNPMRIEQRIGRCHRYGQKRDVTVINFIAKDNEAQAEVDQWIQENNQFKAKGAGDPMIADARRRLGPN